MEIELDIRKYISNAMLTKELPIDASVNDVAVALDVSTTTLSKIANNQQCKIKNLLRDAKIEKAKAMLTYTDIPVEQIAMLCGYSGRRSLDRNLKQSVGVCCGSYRKVTKYQTSRENFIISTNGLIY